MERDSIINFLKGADDKLLFEQASAIKRHGVGSGVYLRGLIELSNRCRKDCLYCGIRRSNSNIERYELTADELLTAAKYAYDNRYGSLVLQAGEQQSERFTSFVCELLYEIKKLSNGQLGITLSLGEQSQESYRRWFEVGAHRYLLRIESSVPSLYSRIHPADHSYQTRLESLHTLREVGYQLGTGVMIGLPGQQIEDLADDLLFLKELDVDMCGMGPYIEHPDAPLGASSYTTEERFAMALRMIALLRILMPDINIASTTALHALDPLGREKGIAAGANIIMPNVTPQRFRAGYRLYNNKPLTDIDLAGFNVVLDEWGDSKHFIK